jgi:restriction system protein
MLPMLELILDGRPYRPAELANAISSQFSIPETTANTIRTDGRTILVHRLEWTRTNLKKEGLVEYCGDGKFRITEKGQLAVRARRIGDGSSAQ